MISRAHSASEPARQRGRRDEQPVLAGRRRLSTFTGRGHDRGAGLAKCAAWIALGQPAVSCVLFPSAARIGILRAFGAVIGDGVLIRHGVRVHWPWKLEVGADSWVGVGAWILNLEPVLIGSNVCISQEVLLCTGSHDSTDPAFEYDNGPIHIGDGAWVATRATVLRGVTVGPDAVVGATALVVRDVPAGARVTAPAAQIRD